MVVSAICATALAFLATILLWMSCFSAFYRWWEGHEMAEEHRPAALILGLMIALFVAIATLLAFALANGW